MIRFALLGAGRIGQMHAANIAGHERCKLSWIYDVHTPSSEALCTNCLLYTSPSPRDLP